MQSSAATVTGIGQAIELLGVLLLAYSVWRGVRKYERLVGEAVRITVEHGQRAGEGDGKAVADRWRDAEFRRLGIPRPHTWDDIGWLRLEMSLFIANDRAVQWLVGVLLVVVGLALTVAGSYMAIGT